MPESLDPQRTMSGHYVKRAWHSARHRPSSDRVLFLFLMFRSSACRYSEIQEGAR